MVTLIEELQNLRQHYEDLERIANDQFNGYNAIKYGAKLEVINQIICILIGRKERGLHE